MKRTMISIIIISTFVSAETIKYEQVKYLVYALIETGQNILADDIIDAVENNSTKG